MPKSPRIYTRLTRTAGSVGSYKSLWLAADHLLMVNSTGYNEEYARVQLRDIKGFFITDSGRRIWWSIFWGIVAFFSALFMGIALSEGETPVGSVILFTPAVIILVWNQLLGPSCKTYIVTGVQTAPLPSVVRRRKFRKILTRLEPLINAAQAGLVPAVPDTPAPSA
jgi:hypothetical protein